MHLRITTPQIQENGILAPMLHGGRFGCGGWFWVAAMANAADFEGQPALGPSGSLPKHASWPKLAKIHQNAQGGWKRLSPRPKCKRFVGTSKQLQKPHKLAPYLGMPWPKGLLLAARANAASQGACLVPGGCHLDSLCILGGQTAVQGIFLLWAASMPPYQCA